MSKKLNKKYPEKLLGIKIKLLEDYVGSNFHHKMQCMICNNIWSATPKSKIQNFKKTGNRGCPNCSKRARYLKNKLRIKTNMLKHGLILLGDFTTNKIPTLAKNIKCGHEFMARPDYMSQGRCICPICNIDNKRKRLQQFNIDRQTEFQKTASNWNIYRHKVYMLTRKIYSKHKNKINPKNLPRGLAGVEGAYHLDHIQSVRYCFDNNIPIEECAHLDNLQMLDWLTNIVKK